MNVYFSYLDLLRQLASKFHLFDEMVLHAIYFPFFLNHHSPPWVCLGLLPSLAWMISQRARSRRGILAGVTGCTTTLSHREKTYRLFLVQGATPIVL